MLPNCQLSACIKCVLTNKNLIKVLDGKTLPKEIGFEDDGSVTTDLPLTLPKLIKVTYITFTDISDKSKKIKEKSTTFESGKLKEDCVDPDVYIVDRSKCSL